MRHLFFLLFFSLNAVQAQELKCAFYNVENLFHPAWDSINTDFEFTKEGKKQWDSIKYYDKLNKLSKVILSMSSDSMEAPSLIGFAELESAKVLEDLIHRPALQKLDYQWVHYDSPDRRGIDVGLIYRKSKLRLIESEAIKYSNAEEPDYKSRDILYCKFYHQDFDSISIYINHWPSRYGGVEKSSPRRIAAAQVLSTHIENNFSSGIGLIMGDFNDEPTDSSLSLLSRETGFKNLMLELDHSWGSHRYKGNWAYLDQILLANSNEAVEIGKFNVHKPKFLLTEDKRYPGLQPFRSFFGDFYAGGFSDHLPIFIELKIKEPNLKASRDD